MPGAFGIPQRPPSGADQHDIAAAHFHSGLLFPCVQVFGVDRQPGLEIRNALQPRDVHQDAARQNPVLEIRNGQPGRALARDILLRVAVVHLALVKHVTK